MFSRVVGSHNILTGGTKTPDFCAYNDICCWRVRQIDMVTDLAQPIAIPSSNSIPYFASHCIKRPRLISASRHPPASLRTKIRCFPLLRLLRLDRAIALKQKVHRLVPTPDNGIAAKVQRQLVGGQHGQQPLHRCKNLSICSRFA